MRCLIFFVLATVRVGRKFKVNTIQTGGCVKRLSLTGKSINIFYDEANRVWRLSISDLGDILYSYEQDHLISVSRFSPEGKLCYAHSYTYDLAGHLIAETLIGGPWGNSLWELFCSKSLYTRNPHLQPSWTNY